MRVEQKHFYITTPIYYVNDRPHLGHAYTTLAADVLARFHRRQGKDVFFLTGTDEHGAKVAASAKASGMEPQAFADQNSALFRDAFQKLDIAPDDFIRTTEERHIAAVAAFMEKLKTATTPKGNPALYEGTYEGLYCVGCERFYTEKELTNGKCPIHKTVPEKVSERNWFFRLTDFLPIVQEAIESGTLAILPASRKQETLGLFRQGLEDFSVSREKVAWGIPFPGAPGQTIYVWVEALQNYLSALGYPDGERFRKFWPVDFHLLGRDILKFHAIYWPALLHAVGLPLPKAIFVHGFFTVNGEKMSKSLGNVIDPNALVDAFGVDGARYLLLSQFPFGEDGDVGQERFKEKYNADLANGLGNLFSRVTNMVYQYLDGKAAGSAASGVGSRFQQVKEQTAALDFSGALETIWRIITEENVSIDRAKPWNLAKDASKRADLERFLSERVLVLQALALALAPFLPVTAETKLGGLSSDRIEKGEALFPRK